MKTALSLLLLALVCGVWNRTDATTTKHFEMLHGWTGIDYVFPDEGARTKMITDKTFIPGAIFPTDIAIEPSTGRIFMAMVSGGFDIPASVATVSLTKDAKGENLLEPYPDWSWHKKGCDGITTVEQMAIDECGRLWIMDTGVIYPKGAFGGYKRICPPEMFVFDLKTDQLIKRFPIPESIVMPDTSFCAITVDVVSTNDTCKNTFLYLADSGYYGLVVYDFAHDDAWRVYANEFYPYPEFGHFHVKGVQFDFMYGVYGMALTPKVDGEDRTMYFTGLASGKMSYVSTSLLKNKTNFVGIPTHDSMYHVSSNVHTYPHLLPGGQMGAIAMDSYGVMYFGSLHESSVYCWNSNKSFDEQHIVLVDQDEEKFDSIYQFKEVEKESGAPDLYVLSNSFPDFLFDIPETNETHFRIMKAPLRKVIEGTTCMGGVDATPRE